MRKIKRIQKAADGLQDVVVPQGGDMMNVASSATSMAASGASIAGPWGAAAGAVVGAGIGLIQKDKADKAKKAAERLNKNKAVMRKYAGTDETVNQSVQEFKEGTSDMNKTKAIEVEKDELIFKKVGKHFQLKADFKGGKKHSEGGEPYVAQEGDVIYPGKQRKKVLDAYKRGDHTRLESMRMMLPKDTNSKGEAEEGLDNDPDGKDKSTWQRFREAADRLDQRVADVTGLPSNVEPTQGALIGYDANNKPVFDNGKGVHASKPIKGNVKSSPSVVKESAKNAQIRKENREGAKGKGVPSMDDIPDKVATKKTTPKKVVKTEPKKEGPSGWDSFLKNTGLSDLGESLSATGEKVATWRYNQEAAYKGKPLKTYEEKRPVYKKLEAAKKQSTSSSWGEPEKSETGKPVVASTVAPTTSTASTTAAAPIKKKGTVGGGGGTSKPATTTTKPAATATKLTSPTEDELEEFRGKQRLWGMPEAEADGKDGPNSKKYREAFEAKQLERVKSTPMATPDFGTGKGQLDDVAAKGASARDAFEKLHGAKKPGKTLSNDERLATAEADALANGKAQKDKATKTTNAVLKYAGIANNLIESFRKPEKVQEDYVKPEEIKYKDRSGTMRKEVDKATNLASKNAAAGSGGNSANMRANAQQAKIAGLEQKEKINNQEQARADQIEAINTQSKNQANQMNVGLRNQYAQQNATARGAKEAYRGQAMSDISAVSQMNEQAQNMKELDDKKLNMEKSTLGLISQAFTSFGAKYNGTSADIKFKEEDGSYKKGTRSIRVKSKSNIKRKK